MMTGLLRRLRGQVRLRAECPYPERILNFCAARGLAFWDVRWESPTAFTCCLSRADARRLRRWLRLPECTLTTVREEGVPIFLGRFRSRPALLAGLVLCATALFLGSFFVWEFEVRGNETVPEEEILRALEKTGVGIGTFGLSLDGESIRNHVLLELPALSWITVNVSGCRARVEVRERTEPPEIVDRRTPANLVARRSGLILEIRALGGAAAVGKGASVQEGQLLVSGVEDTGTFGSRLFSALGTVRARTWYVLTARTDLTAPVKAYTGEERTQRSLILGRRRIKFSSNSSIAGREYDKILQRTPLRLLGLPLPLAWETETFRFYEAEPARRDPSAEEARLGAALGEYLSALVSPYGTAQSELVSSRRDGDVLIVTLWGECEEEIARRVPIYTQNE